jgi:hypothetical protein
MKNRIATFLLIMFLFSGAFLVNAQDSVSVKNNWSFLAEPYAIFPHMNGTVGLGKLPDVSVAAAPGDIFSNLQMGAMLYLEARKGDWSVSSDLIYMSLQEDIAPVSIINYGSVTAKQTAWEMAGLYKINKWLEAGAGFRFNSIHATVEVNRKTLPAESDTTLNGAISRTWIDPFVVTRINAPLKGKWLLQFRGDFSWFGVGSQVAWQTQLDGGYKFSKLFYTTIGYRYLFMNYDKGYDADRFLYKMGTFGPVIRFCFNF